MRSGKSRVGSKHRNTFSTTSDFECLRLGSKGFEILIKMTKRCVYLSMNVKPNNHDAACCVDVRLA